MLLARDTLVLCYHGISDTWTSPSAVPVDRLERQLGYLLKRGYRGVTFSEAVLTRARGKRVAVTFDDGYRSIAEHAAPLLARLGLKATLFVPTGWMSRSEPIAWHSIDRFVGGPHEAELTPMSWAEIASLADVGWEIGSHTRLHRDLTALDDESLMDELAGSREECEERLGRPCRAISYPWGRVDRRVTRATRRAGYLAGAALPVRLHRRTALRWPRVGVYSNDTTARFRAKASPLHRRLIGSRIGEAILRADPA
jgi:peptidoglycan/xylan/chitin deacetylase (PgdA/CDA1 family)